MGLISRINDHYKAQKATFPDLKDPLDHTKPRNLALSLVWSSATQFFIILPDFVTINEIEDERAREEKSAALVNKLPSRIVKQFVLDFASISAHHLLTFAVLDRVSVGRGRELTLSISNELKRQSANKPEDRPSAGDFARSYMLSRVLFMSSTTLVKTLQYAWDAYVEATTPSSKAIDDSDTESIDSDESSPEDPAVVAKRQADAIDKFGRRLKKFLTGTFLDLAFATVAITLAYKLSRSRTEQDSEGVKLHKRVNPAVLIVEGVLCPSMLL